MTSRYFLLLIATFLPGVAAADQAPLAALFTNGAPVRHIAVARRPSIIFIACRGLAPGDLSCYGQTNFQTPNLDRLAAEGARFTDYRAGGDGLAAAQAALMLGTNGGAANGGNVLAWHLQQAGYQTGLNGEWTLSQDPWNQGFAEFGGFLNEHDADNYYSDFVWRYAPRSIPDPTNHTLTAWIGPEEIYANTGGKKGKFIPDLLLGAMANFVRIHVPDPANHFQPFFLQVNLPLPHSVTPGQDDYPVPTDAPFSSENWPQAAKNRAALVMRLDDGIGRLLEQVDQLKLTNEVAIFLAGAVAPEKFANTNMNFLKLPAELRGGASPDRLRVPLIVHWPGHVPAGRVLNTPCSAVDFAPTALALARAKPAPNFPGTSILPALLGRPETNAPPGIEQHP